MRGKSLAVASILCKWDPVNANPEIHLQRPLCVLGPAGTGKTRTLVEAILQLGLRDKASLNFSKHPKSGFLLLVTAPTDVAADVICTRLAPKATPLFDSEGKPLLEQPETSNKMYMLRLNAMTRPRNYVVMNETLKYCLISNRGNFKLPDLTAIKSATDKGQSTVIVCTCAMAALPFRGNEGEQTMVRLRLCR